MTSTGSMIKMVGMDMADKTRLLGKGTFSHVYLI